MSKMAQNRKAYIKARLDRPVVLTGLMGAGKTRIGGLLARALDLPFFDADREIEAAAGCGVADIFALYGEASFRDLERKVVARLLNDAPALKVVALGGGAMCDPQTASLVGTKAVSVWLKADLEVIVERVARNQDRPLLHGKDDPGAVLAGLQARREPFYAQADIHVDSSAAAVRQTLAGLIDSLAVYLQGAADSEAGETETETEGGSKEVKAGTEKEEKEKEKEEKATHVPKH